MGHVLYSTKLQLKLNPAVNNSIYSMSTLLSDLTKTLECYCKQSFTRINSNQSHNGKQDCFDDF